MIDDRASVDKSKKAEQPRFLVALLGCYFVIVAILFSLALYILWPEKSGGTWADSTRLLERVELDADARSLLLVLVAGALGSFVHATTSFVTYVGNKSLVASWAWWYVTRPFLGAVLAVIFHFVLRGGLFPAGASADVSPYGIAAVAGLVGMFSKQATDKLKELFDNLFRTEGGGDAQRKDKLAPAVSVTKAMIPINKITFFEIPEGKNRSDIKIVDLYKKYGGIVTRLPIFDHRGTALHVIHQSLVYQFISKQSINSAGASGPPFDVNALTLNDFLDDRTDGLADAMAFVPTDATLGAAKSKMEETPRCQDVFVTEHGSPDEPVKGWLTNVEIGRLSEA